jgi:OOP family OmpA-OmpF porin
MRHRYLLGVGVGFAATLACASAQAQFYIGAEGGWTSLENQTGSYSFTKPLPGFAGRVLGANEHFDDGFNVGGRFGYMWGHWRFEEEFRHQENEITAFILGGKGVTGIRGDRQAEAIMTNVIYDFSLGWPVSPHIGGGVGAVEQKEGLKQFPGVGQLAHGDNWQFGYQGIAGLRWMASPSVALDLDYRYLATEDPNFKSSLIGTYKSGYSSHNVVASITMLLGPPPPPPVTPPPAPPPPPPPPQRQVFLVFFDWDKDVITPEGMLILQQAATAWRSGAPVQIQVTGYTDRSGSPGYNQRLSERRANNVANAMTGLGIPRDQMAVSGRGENDNRVPTAPGVREPQNRRVEIIWP